MRDLENHCMDKIFTKSVKPTGVKLTECKDFIDMASDFPMQLTNL